MYKPIIQILAIIFLVVGYSCSNKQAKDQEVVAEKIDTTTNSTEESNSKKKIILCYGNSLTAGYLLAEEEAWPSLMQDRIDSLELDYQVINAGLSGETTSGGLNRINWVLNQPIDVFFLELGANDMLRGLSVDKTEENLREIMDVVLEKNPDVQIVLAGMMSPPNMGKEYEDKFNSIYPQLAKEYNAKLIPFFLQSLLGKEELFLEDGKHPNVTGQKVVLEDVWAIVEPLLSKEA